MSIGTSDRIHSEVEQQAAAKQPGLALVLGARLLGLTIIIGGTVLLLRYDFTTLAGRLPQFCFLLVTAVVLALLGVLFNVGEQRMRTAPLDLDIATTKELLYDWLTRPALGVGFGRNLLYVAAAVSLILSVVCLLRTHSPAA